MKNETPQPSRLRVIVYRDGETHYDCHFENWTEVLGSERLTGATLDRLTHRCHIIEASGESYRLRDAKRRRSKRSSSPTTTTK